MRRLSRGVRLRETLERPVVFDRNFHRIHLNTRKVERKGESLWTFASGQEGAAQYSGSGILSAMSRPTVRSAIHGKSSSFIT